MHDALAVTYEADTIAVDDPDAPSGEVVMQVHLPDGMHHRLLPDHSATACGQLFNAARCGLRPERLDGHLCIRCFTDFERSMAVAASAERLRQMTEDTERLYGSDWKTKPRRKK